MKKRYVTPNADFEEFTADATVAATCNENINVTFDCMQGPNTDTTNILSDAAGVTGCKTQAGYTDTATKFVNSDSKSHSNNSSSFSWASGGNSTATLTATEAQGVLYYCTSCGTSGWTLSSDGLTLTHSCKGSQGKHVQIAAVFGDIAVS